MCRRITKEIRAFSFDRRDELFGVAVYLGNSHGCRYDGDVTGINNYSEAAQKILVEIRSVMRYSVSTALGIFREVAAPSRQSCVHFAESSLHKRTLLPNAGKKRISRSSSPRHISRSYRAF